MDRVSVAGDNEPRGFGPEHPGVPSPALGPSTPGYPPPGLPQGSNTVGVRVSVGVGVRVSIWLVLVLGSGLV